MKKGQLKNAAFFAVCGVMLINFVWVSPLMFNIGAEDFAGAAGIYVNLMIITALMVFIGMFFFRSISQKIIFGEFSNLLVILWGVYTSNYYPISESLTRILIFLVYPLIFAIITHGLTIIYHKARQTTK